jgi:hypothetical protein
MGDFKVPMSTGSFGVDLKKIRVEELDNCVEITYYTLRDTLAVKVSEKVDVVEILRHQ